MSLPLPTPRTRRAPTWSCSPRSSDGGSPPFPRSSSRTSGSTWTRRCAGPTSRRCSRAAAPARRSCGSTWSPPRTPTGRLTSTRACGPRSQRSVRVQAYLRRTAQDVERLIELGATVRLCKGAYREPPELAFPAKRDVDANYARLLDRLFAADAQARSVYVGVATHDTRLITRARDTARREGSRASDSRSRCSTGSGGLHARIAATGSGSGCSSRTARTGMATSCAGSPSARRTRLFPSPPFPRLGGCPHSGAI